MPSVVIRWVDDAGVVQSRSGADAGVLPADASLVWVDVTAPDDAVLDELCERFDFHTLAIEDVRHTADTPQARHLPGRPVPHVALAEGARRGRRHRR